VSKVKNAEKKELELREQRANAEKAEVELARERIYLATQKREHKRKTKSDPEKYGRFKFNAEVSQGNVEIFTDQLERWSRLNPRKPITVVLTSPGGSVLAGWGLYDTLRTLSAQGHHITTQVRGYAASMGAVLLQAGDTRLVGAESYVMLHEVSSVAYGKLHEIKDQSKFTRKLNSRIFEVIASRTNEKWTGESLYNWAKAKDRWVSASECVAEGFADGIG
jgi:ATP-dependent Clp protease protease subunit